MFVWYDINSNLIDKDLVQIPFIVYTTIYAGHQKEHAQRGAHSLNSYRLMVTMFVLHFNVQYSLLPWSSWYLQGDNRLSTFTHKCVPPR